MNVLFSYSVKMWHWGIVEVLVEEYGVVGVLLYVDDWRRGLLLDEVMAQSQDAHVQDLAEHRHQHQPGKHRVMIQDCPYRWWEQTACVFHLGINIPAGNSHYSTSIFMFEYEICLRPRGSESCMNDAGFCLWSSFQYVGGELLSFKWANFNIV